MATRTITAASGLAATLRVHLVADDGRIWNADASTLETFAAADIADYGLALAETAAGSGIYTYDLPAALLAGWYRERPHDSSLGFFEARERFYWSGTAAMNPPPAAGAQWMTIGEAADLLKHFARAAGGRSDDNTGRFSPADCDVALMGMLCEFNSRSRVTRLTTTLTLANGQADIDMSAVEGFEPERVLSIYLADECPIDIVSMTELTRLRKHRARTGAPTRIAFSDFATMQTWETADDDYALKIEWWPPATSWVVGSGEANADQINVPRELLVPAIQTGGVVYLQSGLLPESPIIIQKRRLFEELCMRTAGRGGYGAKSLHRESLRSTRYRG